MTIREEFTLFRKALSQKELVIAEVKALGITTTTCAYNSFMGTAVTTIALVASMWPLQGIEWNNEVIWEAYRLFMDVWSLVFLIMVALILLFDLHHSPIGKWISDHRKPIKIKW